MDAHTERMPGDAEAAAAAAGMAETYGRARHAVGDSIWFSPTVGAMPREGKVIELGDHGCLVVQAGETYLVTPSQIAEF